MNVSYRTMVPVVRLDTSRNLIKLSKQYEKTYTRGTQMVQLLCAGLYPMSKASTWTVVFFCVIPSVVALSFMLLGTVERFADVPLDVAERARALGVARKRLEFRHRWVERVWVAEDEAWHGHL